MGRSRSRPLKAHQKSEHFTRTFRGWFWLGDSLKEPLLNASRTTDCFRAAFA
jgi:hypothetical protein